MRRERSIEPDYFEGLFRDKADPWEFETSAYEAEKYAETLRALPAERFGDVLEVGCANGVLTAMLGPRCGRLLAVDVSETALAAARRRCADQPHIRFARQQLPQDRPVGPFDLILLSEVVYYWDSADIGRLASYLREQLRSGGYLLLVHWLGETDYPKSGDDAVRELRELLAGEVHVARADRHDRYRLDLWQRS